MYDCDVAGLLESRSPEIAAKVSFGTSQRRATTKQRLKLDFVPKHSASRVFFGITTYVLWSFLVEVSPVEVPKPCF